MPGSSGCGNVHFPPNGLAHYDYGNVSPVSSRCDDYLSWPNLSDQTAPTDVNTWGVDDPHLRFLQWWMVHLPKAAGIGSDGRELNWWRYIADVDRVP